MNSVKQMVMTSLLVLVCSGMAAAQGDEPSIEKGKALFNDPQLGTAGQSCNTCHPGGQGLEYAAMDSGLPATVNRCIMKRLKGPPLQDDSVAMKSLVLYIQSLAKK